MDPKTLAYYTENATEIARRYESVVSPVERYFVLAFTPGARVLDVGCGSGRDAARLLDSGYDAYGIEPVEALRHAAIADHPELAGRIGEGGLPRAGDAFGGEFDIKAEDVRRVTGYQDFVDNAPLDLVYVADHGRMKMVPAAQREAYASVAAGAMSQNVYLFCASQGLGTVVRAWFDRDALTKAMGLTNDQQILLTQTVGYAKR